jgi:hypothetical protein
MALARPSDNERAALLGTQPSRSAMSTTRRLVSSDTPGRPLSAYDTAPVDTPAAFAMSEMVGRLSRTDSPYRLLITEV